MKFNLIHMKKESFWSLRIIVIVGFILLLSLLYFYPYVVDTIMCHYLQQHKFNNEPSDRGTFGDMYGALNSFLSGLAVLGIVLTLFWEKKVQEDKEESLDRDKLIYFSSVLNGTINTTKSFKSRLLENCDAILQDASQVPALVRDTNRHIIKTIIIQEKYEEYFLAYRRIFHKDDIFETFSVCIYLDEAISECIKNYDEYYVL